MADIHRPDSAGTREVPPLQAPRIAVPRRRGRFFARYPWPSLGGAAIVVALLVGVLLMGGEI
ncbi:hypothetical protein [Reyranella sp.]|uniref:hypothetical protein n=1 Tax=Reyranella sp. TaxID=1929291 RepID=UPI003BAA2002